MLAMQRAVAGLHIAPDMVLIDGNRCPNLPMRSQAVVKGDSRGREISGRPFWRRSRDREMAELDSEFPDYGFAQHKGCPDRPPPGAAGCVGRHRASSPQLRAGEKSAGAVVCGPDRLDDKMLTRLSLLSPFNQVSGDGRTSFYSPARPQ